MMSFSLSACTYLWSTFEVDDGDPLQYTSMGTIPVVVIIKGR